MKNVKLLSLLSVMPLLLTGCSKKLSAEEYKQYLDETKTYLTEDFSHITDVHIQNKLSVTTFDYKVNEFFSYNYIGLLGIGGEREVTWKDGEKYYYYHSSPLHRDNEVKEIDAELFYEYMDEYKVRIQTELMRPVYMSYQLYNGGIPDYKKADNTFKRSIKKEYSHHSVATKEVPTTNDQGESVNVDVEDVYDIVLKDKYPLQYKYVTKNTPTDDGSETTWKYSYGNAKLNKPSQSN